MKKGNWIGLAAIIIIVAAIFAAVMFYFGNSAKVEKEGRAEITDLFVGYVNIDQLAQKGALEQYFNLDNRKLIASIVASDIKDKAMAERATAIITDLNTSGINLKQPAYCYADEHSNLVAILEVTDANMVDKTAELASYIIKQETGKDIIVEHDGDSRFIEPDGNIILAYNDTRFVIASNSAEYVSKELVIEALGRPLLDLSIFGDSDMAYYVDCAKGFNILKNLLAATKAEYQTMSANIPSYADRAMEIDEVILQLDSIAPHIGEKAHAILALTFEAGRATVKATINDIDVSESCQITKQTSNDHLKYISSTAPIVANIGLSGTKLVDIINLVLDSRYFLESEFNNNEVNMIISIICDAFKSINGDLTIAIEDLKGRSNYYGDAMIQSASVAVIADVTDTYIISNLGQFAGGFLSRKDSTHYAGNIFGFNISIGQDDNVFHAGVNTTYDIKTESAENTEWFADVANSHAYLVVDVDNLMNCSYIAAANKMLINNINYEYREFYTQFVGISDYIYASHTDTYSSEFVIVLKDKESNALKQVADIILPTLTQELMQNM